MGTPILVCALACTTTTSGDEDAGLQGDAGLGEDPSASDAETGTDPGTFDGGVSDAGSIADGGPDANLELPERVRVRVTLDGVPAVGARVSSGGSGV